MGWWFPRLTLWVQCAIFHLCSHYSSWVRLIVTGLINAFLRDNVLSLCSFLFVARFKGYIAWVLTFWRPFKNQWIKFLLTEAIREVRSQRKYFFMQFMGLYQVPVNTLRENSVNPLTNMCGYFFSYAFCWVIIFWFIKTLTLHLTIVEKIYLKYYLVL